MAMVMEGGVMVIEGARVTWYVVETTARSLVLTTMRRMTVVRSLAIKDGVTGVAGHLVTVGTNRGSEFARGSSVIWQQRTNKRKPGYQGWGDWSSWSSCDRGYKQRVRVCKGIQCDLATEDKQEKACKIRGFYR